MNGVSIIKKYDGLTQRDYVFRNLLNACNTMPSELCQLHLYVSIKSNKNISDPFNFLIATEKVENKRKIHILETAMTEDKENVV